MNAADIKKVACCGAGVIGSSFAAHFALKGYPVNVYEINDGALENARKSVGAVLDSLQEEQVITAEQKAEIEGRICYTTDPAVAFGDVQFIQENGPERLEIKQSIVETLDRYAPDSCVVASSTSGMKISDIAAKSEKGGRYVGAHPWNPPHLIPLVEIAKGEKTNSGAVQTAVDFYKAVDKEPVVMQKEKLGFVANRLAHALWREEMAIVNEGVCTLEECDAAYLFGPGLRTAIYGPGMVYELGSPVGLRGTIEKFSTMSEMVFADLSNADRYPEGFADVADAQIKDEIAHLPDFKGKTREEQAKWRDHMLVELLKLHHKL